MKRLILITCMILMITANAMSAEKADVVTLNYFASVVYCGSENFVIPSERRIKAFKETHIYKYLSALRDLDKANGVNLDTAYSDYQKSLMAQLDKTTNMQKPVIYSQYMTSLSAIVLQNCDQRLKSVYR